MSTYETRVDFQLPLTKEQAEFIEGLLKACITAQEGDTTDVPAAFAEHVKRIDPEILSEAMDLELDWLEEDVLNVRNHSEDSDRFLLAWLTEIARRFNLSLDFEWWGARAEWVVPFVAQSR